MASKIEPLLLQAIRLGDAQCTVIRPSKFSSSLLIWLPSKHRALAACVFPALFSALILIDPVIIEPAVVMTHQLQSYQITSAALNRRDQWSSRYSILLPSYHCVKLLDKLHIQPGSIRVLQFKPFLPQLGPGCSEHLRRVWPVRHHR